MTSVLLRALSFVLIILVGITLRSTGLVPDDTGQHVKKILLYVTLPCTIITNFSRVESLSGSMVLLVPLAIIACCIMMAVGIAVTRGRDRRERAMFMLCLPAFNVGAFGLPFVQSFLPAIGSVAACIFDVGNSIMCTGGTYAFTAEYTAEKKGNGFDIPSFIKKLITSPPLVTYVVMFVLTLAHVTIPEFIETLIAPAANANPFIAMLMIGLLFRLELKKESLLTIAKIIGLRQCFAVLFALFNYFVLPFEESVRLAMVLVCFTPMSVVAPAYTGMCGGDEGLASAANSISILLSILELTILLIVLGLY